jgi:hypothetical protein
LNYPLFSPTKCNTIIKAPQLSQTNAERTVGPLSEGEIKWRRARAYFSRAPNVRCKAEYIIMHKRPYSFGGESVYTLYCRASHSNSEFFLAIAVWQRRIWPHNFFAPLFVAFGGALVWRDALRNPRVLVRASLALPSGSCVFAAAAIKSGGGRVKFILPFRPLPPVNGSSIRGGFFVSRPINCQKSVRLFLLTLF